MTTTQDVSLELRTLYTICEKKGSKEVAKLLATLSKEHFSSTLSYETFKRIQTMSTEKGQIPSWSDLLTDPAVSKSVRTTLKSKSLKPIKRTDIDSTLTTLDSLRRVRGLIELGVELQESLEADTINTEAIVQGVMDRVNRIVEGVDESIITHTGDNESGLQKVRHILKGKGEHIIPTGIKTYDDKNKGFPEGALVILGGTTGAGKSLLASQLCDNIALNGGKVGIVPLEMTTEENMTRQLSRISQTNSLKFLNPSESMSEEERKQIYKQYKRHSEKIRKRGGRITTIEPRFAPTMEKLLQFVEPMSLDMLIIDYVGLLDGVNVDNQATMLSKVTAYAKLWATRNKCVVAVLVQIDDELKVRYSRAMMEHASHCWLFSAPKNEETMITDVVITKARMATKFTFPLVFDYKTMTVRDASPEELEYHISLQKSDQQRKWTKGSKNKKAKEKDDGEKTSGKREPGNKKSHARKPVKPKDDDFGF